MNGTDPAGRPPTDVDPRVRQAVIAAGAVVAAFFAILILRWVVRQVFTGFGALLFLLTAAAIGGYLFYRKQNPSQARQWETRLRGDAQNVIDRTMATARSAPPGTPPAQTPAPTPAGSQYWTPNAARAGTAVSTTGSGGLTSAALLIPTLIAYGVLYGGHPGFSSAWQPWWILTGLNVYFIVCAAARSLPGRGALAALFGLAGSVLFGLATSPSPESNLLGLLSQKHYYEGEYAYSSPPEDLIPWINRAPTLALLLFVVAWGISRRRNGGWVVGLFPAVLLVALTIWYTEHHFTGAAGWFGWWVTSVGVFVGGCLACWVFDAMTVPRTPVPPPDPVRY
jgi:hypothetical protein